ncbi:MAG TPA: RDD family protein [Acidimicrobiia bacterium]|jgi:curved DNA-binding protein CbpA
MNDYYELLGVPVNADKDTIRTAYRNRLEDAEQNERAELNKAWNVLSDPIQRGRYDAELNEIDVDEPSDDDIEVLDAPARRNGAGARQPAAARPRPEPTIEMPAGLTLAETRKRNRGFYFDLLALVLIGLVVYYAATALQRAMYPTQTKKIDSLSKQITDANNAKKKADSKKSTAQDQLKAAQRSGDTEAQKNAQAAETKATNDSKAAQKKSDDLTKQHDDLQSSLPPFVIYATVVIFLLGMAYTVPMSARGGQTLGKKRAQVRLVHVDGSPAGWAASVIHYGVPIGVTCLLLGFIGPLALVAGLALVLIRDRNRQGLHDRMAKTIIVDA